MEEDIGLVVLEHLGHEFDVHIVYVDILNCIRFVPSLLFEQFILEGSY